MAHLAEGGRGQVAMACGSGKTLVAVRSATALLPQGGTVLVLVPSLGLLAQTVRAWRADAGVPLQVLAVCSDQAAERGPDDAGSLEELTGELGLEATTDPVRITAFLSSRPPAPAAAGLRVLFGTYHSSGRIAQAFADCRPAGPALAPLDLVVFDEAHRCAGDPGAPFAVALHQERVPAVRRLFLTATPKVHAGTGEEAGLVGMDNEGVFGPRLFTLSFGQAIAAGLLQDYRLVVVGVTDADVHKLVLDNPDLDLGRSGTARLPAATAAAQIALAGAALEFGLSRVLAFHNRVGDSRTFARTLAGTVAALPAQRRPAAHLSSTHLDGAMGRARREETLAQLDTTPDAQWTVVSNVRVLAEGIDVPALDAVAFVAPRGSQIDITQAVGRALRTSPGRSTPSVILLPVYLADGESGEAVLEDSAFRHVWQTVRALRDHDDRLDAALGRARRELGEGTGEPRPVLPDLIALRFPAQATQAFLNSFTTRVIEHGSDSYDYGIGALTAYVAEHGHASPPADYRTEGGYQLGSWVGRIRTARRQGLLRPDRAREVEALPGWQWDPEQARWERGFAALERFVAEHGHARPQQRHRNSDGYLVGRWTEKQRAYHASGHPCLTVQRVQRLSALPGWDWQPSQSRGWPVGLRALRAHAAHHGTVAGITPSQLAPDGYPVGRWLHSCRTRYRRGHLTSAQVAELEALPGWRWNAHQDLWPVALAALRAFNQEHGATPIPHDCVTSDGFDLGSWAVRARQRFVDGRLPLAKAAELAAHPAWSWSLPAGKRWQQLLDQTRAYTTRHGHCRIPVTHTTDSGYLLGRNITAVRSRHHARTLPARHTRELDEVPGWDWDIAVDYDDDGWQHGYTALQQHAAEHGSAAVGADHRAADGFALGLWAAAQLREHRTGRLAPARTAALEALPGWDWSYGTRSWHARRKHEARARELGYPDLATLLTRNQHLTHRQIAIQVGISDATVAKWRTALRADIDADVEAGSR
ncbi:superfamily II DNA or RNA helicase [Streptacidiphilus sp. MAP5-52]